ncbi:MAG: NAD(+) synthase [Clostridia bacterium]|nr:NAD(+) synthase [Clostridia bacterium]
MKHGFIKVCTATPNVKVADTAYNTEAIIKNIKEASTVGVKLIVFPELSVTGYTCADLFAQDILLKSAEASVKKILENTASFDLVSVIGAPVIAEGSVYNCACIICRGKLYGIVPKSKLSNRFYEGRFASAPTGTKTIEYAGQSCCFCKDLIFACHNMPSFTFCVEIGDTLSSVKLINGANIIVNPSASNEIVGRAEKRRMLISAGSAALNCGYIYVNAGEGESTTDLVFSGHSIIAENGKILTESKLFSGDTAVTEIDADMLASERRNKGNNNCEGINSMIISFDLEMNDTVLTRNINSSPFIPSGKRECNARCEEILAMQASGLKKRIAHTRCSGAVVGISGGLDSCLALLVTVCAMDSLGRPRTDIHAITMPCFGTTKRTKSNAEILCNELGVKFSVVDITKAVRVHMRDIGQSEDCYDVTYENCQARERTQVLMDIANRTGGLVIGTGDLSELALGWATYNGDHMSMYGVNGSVPKTLVRHIVRYYADTTKNPELAKVLYDILDTPVSPELLPAKDGEIAQKTEDIVGPYELHDFYLYYLVRYGFTPAKIFRMACHAFDGQYDRSTIKKWLVIFMRRFFMQQFKRSCIPDGPKVGSVSLSPRGDFNMPSDAAAVLWVAEAELL